MLHSFLYFFLYVVVLIESSSPLLLLREAISSGLGLACIRSGTSHS